MAGPDVVYRADLDDSSVQKKIDRLQNRLDELGKRGEAGFNKISASVKAGAIVMGVMSGLVTTLSDNLLRMGRQAVANVIRNIKELVSEIANSSAEFKEFSGQLDGVRDELIAIAGEEFFEGIREDAGRLLDILEQQRGPLSDIATTFGRIIALVERGTLGVLLDKLHEVEPETMQDFADATQRLADSLSQLTDREITGDFNGLIEMLTMLSDTLTTLINLYNKVNEISNMPGLKQAREVITAILSPIGRLIVVIGALTDLWHDLNTEMEKFLGFSMVDVTAGLAKASAPLAGRAGMGAPRRPEAGGEAGGPIIPKADKVEKEADDTLAKVKAFYDRLAELEQKSARARERVADLIARTNEETIDAQRRRLEIDIATERKRLDNEIENAQAIEDVWRRHYQDLADAARELSRDEEDARRDAVRQEMEIERDAAGARLSAETDFRRELQRIRDRFNMAAAEAERNNDAQAFLAAMRQRDEDTQEAQRTRGENVEDAKLRAEEQRAALQEQLAFELEDARIANGRKLEDLQLTLQRELEAEAIKAARAEEERQREYARELEDFARKEAERIADLNKSLASEIDLVRRAEAAKRQIRVAEARATIAQVQAIMQQMSLRDIPYTGSGRNPSAGRRQEGGPVDANRAYVVGERGPELYVPDRAGFIVPNAAISPAAASINNYNQQRSMDVGGIHVGQSIFDDPVSVRRMQNLILSTLSDVL